MIDQQKILQTFRQHFHYSGEVTVDRDGLISCTKDVKLSRTYQGDRLPCAFKKVDGRFSCSNSRLQTLVGAPLHVGLSFSCSNSQLKTLQGAPRACRDFFVQENQLDTLKGGPHDVRGNYWCYNNPLTSLEGIAHHIGEQFWCDFTPDLGLLRILATGSKDFYDKDYAQRRPITIINKYLEMGGGWNRMVPCAREMIRAGFRGNAKL